MRRLAMSRTVTVTFAAVLPSAGTEDRSTVTVERLALGGAGAKGTSTDATMFPFALAKIVSVPGSYVRTLPVARPSAPVAAAGWTTVAAPDRKNLTVAPGTAFPYWSLMVAMRPTGTPSS
jgi:hypothetical protein